MTPYDQVAAVLAAASGGTSPWKASEDEDGYWSINYAGDGEDWPLHGHVAFGPEEADARFIALARNTYPELLAVARAAKAHTGSECRCGTLTHSSTCQLVITEDALRAALSDLEAKIREVMP
jgi:hypothetical protein